MVLVFYRLNSAIDNLGSVSVEIARRADEYILTC